MQCQPDSAAVRQPGNRQPGFTLVELLVALAVMALLTLMAWRGLDAMSRNTNHLQARSDELSALQNGMAQWGNDLDAMVDAASLPPAAAPGTNPPGNAINAASASKPAPIDWNGQVLRVVRFANTGQGTGLRVVAWSRRGTRGQVQWLRWQSDLVRKSADLQAAWARAALWAQNPDDAARAREVVLGPMVDWALYYYRNDAWSNPQSSTDAANTVPDGVRLVLTLPEGGVLAGVITRDWVRPTVAGNKS